VIRLGYDTVCGSERQVGVAFVVLPNNRGAEEQIMKIREALSARTEPSNLIDGFMSANNRLLIPAPSGNTIVPTSHPAFRAAVPRELANDPQQIYISMASCDNAAENNSEEQRAVKRRHTSSSR
jgi:hypothetical protein